MEFLLLATIGNSNNINILIFPEMGNFLLACIGALFTAGITFFLCRYKFKTPKGKKRILIFTFSLLGLIVLYIISYFASNIIGCKQIKEKVVEMERSGIPASIENIPQKLFQFGEFIDNSIFFYEASQKLAIYLDFPLSTLSIKNKTDDITLWKEEDRKTALKILSSKTTDQVFNLLHQGTEKTDIAYYRDYTQGIDPMLSEISSRRTLIRLMSMKIQALGFEGKASEGYTIIYDGFRAIKQFESDPLIMAQLINQAYISVSINAMDRLLKDYGIDDLSAKQLLTALDQFEINNAMRLAIGADIVLVNHIFFKPFSKGQTDKIENINPLYFSKPGTKAIASFFFYWDWNYYITHMLKIRDLYLEPYWEVTDKIKELDTESQNVPCYYPISKTIIHPFSQGRIKTAKTESEIACAKVKLALHIYKNEHGEFPEKLEQLSKILTVIPVDPMTGNALSYSKDGTSFKLSCTWLDEKAKKAIKK